MLADDSEQDDIREVIKEVLYEPRDNPLTQSEASPFIVDFKPGNVVVTRKNTKDNDPYKTDC